MIRLDRNISVFGWIMFSLVEMAVHSMYGLFIRVIWNVQDDIVAATLFTVFLTSLLGLFWIVSMAWACKHD